MSKEKCSFCKEDFVYCKSLCRKCYNRKRISGSPVYRRSKKGQLVANCKFCKKEKLILARGYCRNCYDRVQRNGTPEYQDRRTGKTVQQCLYCKEVKTIHARGYCSACYQRMLANGTSKRIKVKHICSIDGCDKYVAGKSLCSKHYSQWYRLNIKNMSLEDKIKLKIAHPLYETWSGMKSRCYNKRSTSYHLYGGKGVVICERWHDFWNFVEDMGLKPSNKDSIERINGNGNYEPDNCKWATSEEQAQNLTTSAMNKQKAVQIKLLLKEKMQTIASIARQFNVSESCIRHINKGRTWKNIQV